MHTVTRSVKKIKAKTANRVTTVHIALQQASLSSGCVPVSFRVKVPYPFVHCKLTQFTFLSVTRGVKVSPHRQPSSGWGHTTRSKGGRSYGEAEQRSVSLLHPLRFALRLSRPNDIGTLNERERGQTGLGEVEEEGSGGVGGGRGSVKVRRRKGSDVDLFQSAVGREEWPVWTELFSSRRVGEAG